MVGLVIFSQPPHISTKVARLLNQNRGRRRRGKGRRSGGNRKRSSHLLHSHPCFEAWDVTYFCFFFVFFSLIVLLPVLGCGRRIRYHCLGRSPAPLVHHTALPPSGGFWEAMDGGMYGQGRQVFIFQKTHQSGAHMFSPITI